MRKVVMNKHNNLLQLEEHFYQLVDVDEPNTFRNLFPYEEIPKIAFNDRIVPHNMPDDIWITDTTFRDGQQSRAPYTTDQIVTIYDYLHKLGGPKGIVRQSEFFLYSKKDRDAVYKCMEGKRAQVDYLVTNDRKLLEHADLAAKTPRQMMSILALAERGGAAIG